MSKREGVIGDEEEKKIKYKQGLKKNLTYARKNRIIMALYKVMSTSSFVSSKSNILKFSAIRSIFVDFETTDTFLCTFHLSMICAVLLL